MEVTKFPFIYRKNEIKKRWAAGQRPPLCTEFAGIVWREEQAPPLPMQNVVFTNVGVRGRTSPAPKQRLLFTKKQSLHSYSDVGVRVAGLALHQNSVYYLQKTKSPLVLRCRCTGGDFKFYQSSRAFQVKGRAPCVSALYCVVLCEVLVILTYKVVFTVILNVVKIIVRLVGIFVILKYRYTDI